MTEKAFKKIEEGLKDALEIARGSGNVFRDLGLEQHARVAELLRAAGIPDTPSNIRNIISALAENKMFIGKINED